MEVVKTHIVFRKALFNNHFIKVFETEDGRYFREIGSGDAVDAFYEEISPRDFEEMKENYKRRVK